MTTWALAFSIDCALLYLRCMYVRQRPAFTKTRPRETIIVYVLHA